MNEERPKLNLFAIPSQTSLLFAGILFVIGAPLLLNLFTRYTLRFPLLGLVVLLFTLWDFLSAPDREIARRAAQPPAPADSGAAAMAAQIVVLAQEAKIAPPTLLVTPQRLEAPFVFGTWRRRYLLCPAWLAAEWAEDQARADVSSNLDVVLRHELAHFANHDVWLAGFARSLLKMTVIVLFAYWFALLWEPVVYASLLPYWSAVLPYYLPLIQFLPANVQPFVLNPPERTWNAIVVDWLEVTMSLLPMAGGALILWWRDWNLLVRVREAYADARVASWRGDSSSLERALTWFRANTQAKLAALPPASRKQLRWRLPRAFHTQPALSWAWDAPVRPSLRVSPQPKQSTRRHILRRPELVYGTAGAVARHAALIVLLYYLINASLLGARVEGIGSEVTIGAGFVVLALGLTPGWLANLAEAGNVHRTSLRATVIFLGIFNIVLLLILLIGAIGVSFRPQDLDLVFYAIAGVMPRAGAVIEDDPLGYILQVIAGSFLIFFIVAPLLLYGWLRLDFAVKKRILSWGGAPWLVRRSQWILLWVTGVLAFLLVVGILPLLTLAAFPGILFSPANSLWDELAPRLLGVGIALVVLLVSGILFFRFDRRYGRRCPHCDARVVPPDDLGSRCPDCGASLLGWLQARY